MKKNIKIFIGLLLVLTIITSAYAVSSREYQWELDGSATVHKLPA